MKTLLKQIYRELFTKKVLATAAVVASFIFISTAGFNAMMDDTNAAFQPGCDSRADITANGVPLTGFPSPGQINVSGGKATITVKNNSETCTYKIGLASYEVNVPLGTPETDPGNKNFIRTQTLFDSFPAVNVLPGGSMSFNVDLPSCAWQVDLFEGNSAPAVPDFEELQNDGTHKLLDFEMFWNVNPNLPICGDTPPPPECPAEPDWERDIDFTTTNPVVDNDPFAHTVIKMLNGNTRAEVTLTNTSECHSYTFGLAAYKTFNEWGTVPSQEFIEEQELFPPADIQTVEPGESAIFRVDLPQCTWQVDFFEGSSAPAIPDFAKLEQQGTHDLIDAVIYKDVTSGLLVCGFVEPQCPAVFDTTPVVIHGQTSLSVAVGAQVNYSFSITGPGTKVVDHALINAGLQGTGLTYNPGSRTITGTMPNKTVEFTIDVDAIDDATNKICGGDDLTVTITPDNSCPIDPVEITSSSTKGGQVGEAFSYTITTTGGAPITYSIQSGTLPAGLTLTGNVISGTPTQATTKTVVVRAENQCGPDTLSLTIDIVSAQCPGDFVKPLINGQTNGEETLEFEVGEEVDYVFTITGDGEKNISTTSLSGTGLTFQNNVLSGPMPDQTVEFTVTVVATDNGTGIDCGVATRKVTLVPETVNDQCPADFEAPNITSSSEIKNIKGGMQIDYLITFTEGDAEDLELDVTDLPSWLSFNDSTNRVTGVVPERGNYSFKIELTTTDPEECPGDTLTVRLSPSNPGGKCINCDDDDEPRVLARSTRFTDEPGEVLESFVVLTQIPQTGVGSFFETILFTVGLLVLSALIAYFIMSRRMREKLANVFAGGSAFAGGNQYGAYEQYDSPVRESTADIAGAYPFGAVALPSRETNVDHRISEIKNRNNPMDHGTGSQDFGTQIAQGLEELATKKQAEEADDIFAREMAGDTSALEARIEEKAREDNALISDDGVKLIVTASNANEKNAFAILDQLLRVSENWYEREEGWLLLNKTKIKDVLFATYLTMTPVFIGWMAEGNEKNVFGFLRMLRSQGHSVKEFIKHAVYELDSLYRERTDGNAEVDPHTVKVARNWNAKTIEKMIAILIGAVDETYSEEFTSIKIAVLKALSLAKEGEGSAKLLSSGK